MKKCMKIFCFFILLSLILSACSKSQTSAEDTLFYLSSILDLPSGRAYTASSDEGSEAYFSDELFSTLYSSLTLEECREKCEDFAIYLSEFPMPYEAAVFNCRSRADTHSIEKMCLERADALSVLLKDTDFSYLSQKACVVTRGRRVVMVLCEDFEKAEREADKALRRASQ